MKGGNKVAAGGGRSLEGLPDTLITEILEKLDLESLCSTACASRAFRSSVAQHLSTLPSLDLSVFAPNAQTLNHILHRFSGVRSVTIDCLRLETSSVIGILGANIQELNLLKGCLLSYSLFTSIGRSCPNLRVLALELVGEQLPELFEKNLVEMLKNLIQLESLSLKIREIEHDVYSIKSIQPFLPRSLRFLKLQQVGEQSAIQLLQEHLNVGNSLEITSTFSSIPAALLHPPTELQHLSLVLDIISDELVICIVNALPLIVELNLEDRTYKEPLMPHDLTNNGIQSLGSCRRLTALSIVRSRQNYPVCFKRINDLAMFLLSENCRGLESVTFGGFSTVTDAGFSAILHSCRNLKRFEIRNASLLSDLTFHSMAGAADTLVEMKMFSCNLITSEAVLQLASCTRLEVLDLCGCRSIADTCLSCLTFFNKLATLNLSGADVTDNGLAVLGGGHSPIARLRLRGCRRITDKGISLLLLGRGTISKTLASLDVGYMPGISDEAIYTIASSAQAVTELCMRYCFFVTDASLKALALKRRPLDGTSPLKRLDVFHCPRLSAIELVGFLRKPSFLNLRWLGVGLTAAASRKDDFAQICKERAWLTLCFDGCEIGCHDGWQFHRPHGG
ncbi:F-box protein At-B [Coffea arabica]|uniref:F-box protein At-B n=1 Tax=Coffea arabica TaxID=13443 RepID=A0A6P6S9Y0_COFAR|nr:F-box protein At-B [Coffea arabica]